jgi:hypothetical protein
MIISLVKRIRLKHSYCNYAFVFRTSINSKGTKVVNWVKFILGVIAKTVTATFNFSGMKYKYMLVASFKKIMKWAFNLVNKIFNVQSDLVKVVI